MDLPAEIPSCFIFNEKWQQLRPAVSAARALAAVRSKNFANNCESQQCGARPAETSGREAGPGARKISQKQPSWRDKTGAITSSVGDTGLKILIRKIKLNSLQIHSSFKYIPLQKICYKVEDFDEGTERLWISSNTTNMSSNSANLN